MKQIYDGIAERVTNSYYGYKILAAYRAYGSEYDFCKFYSCGDGIVHIYNSSMIIDGNIDISELEMLIEMIKPATIEVSTKLVLQIQPCYLHYHRTLFHLTTNESDVNVDCVKVNGFMRDCYEILKESFENMGDFDSWYVDINHRIRHQVSNLYLYDSTTVTQQFNINKFVFLSHIATAESERGKGTARRLLYFLAEQYKTEGYEAYLWALDHRKSFYESIGFEPVAEDILYEMEG
ncbi:MAG: GNAT family N-acetyltransferase [Oscillospiraceae bacterium]|nr:GNAT family N-acetyltransferase [Oscillospiraceae bacterium]